MPLTLPPPLPTREGELALQLNAVAARLRRVVFVRSVSWLVVFTLLFLGGLAVLDYRYQLPALVRALGLGAYLVALPLLVRRWVLKPLAGSGDPVRTALRVEKAYPEFNDSLVSAVVFLRQGPADRTSSPALRRAAIRRASRKAERYDFDRAVDSRGTKRSALAAILLTGLAAWALVAHPERAKAAMIRIAAPFGGTRAPTQTSLDILAPQPLPHRMARGEPLDLRFALRGVIPERVSVAVRLEGSPPVEQSYTVPPVDPPADATEMAVRIEPTRIPRDFQFRVRANDADSGWQTVYVLPPPVLVPLDGRPSPQLRLDFPAYTDLPPTDLPDGSGVIECVAGTRVTLRAATDRPVARAWIGFRPDQPLTRVFPALSPLGAKPAAAVPGFELLGREVWADVPLGLSQGGTRMEVTFVPRLSGPYALRFEDDSGLGTTRMFDVRVQPDPVPVVTMDRPSATRDSLLVLPDAEVTFGARVTDKQYAIRSVWLEYRTNLGGRPQTIPWFDAGVAGSALPAAASLMRGPVPLPRADVLRLRPQQLGFEQRLSLSRFRHADGTPLRAGDVLTVQVAADDFDDVTGFKPPGRSHEVELVIVSKQDLETVEQEAQSDLRGEILRLHAQQREARAKVQDAIQQIRNSGRLRPEDSDRLAQAEQTQQQIRSRINNPDDGLRAKLDKLKQSSKDNHLPKSATTERLDAAAGDLARLANEELEPLEADLAAARRPADPKDSPAAPLGRAEKRQREVEQTLLSLLERLEPWSGAGEVRGEARSVLNDLKRQLDKGEKLAQDLPPDTPAENLRPDQKAELDRAAVGDDRLAERGRQLVEKMNRLAVEKDAVVRAKLDLADRKDAEARARRAQAEQAPLTSADRKDLLRQADDLEAEARQSREAAEDLKREADALRNAAMAGNSEQLKEQLRAAGQLTRQNQLGRAAGEQKAATGNLERMLGALEEQKAEDADRMSKKLKDADRELDDLFDRQERLQKKVEAAQNLKDPEQRQAELEKLAREQAKLEAEARDVAQRLTRNQADRAAEELRRAAREMAQAREQLENGDPAGAKMDDALDRLDDAQRELDQVREKNEEELLREQAAKFADEIKALRDRAQRLVDESDRIHQVVKKAGKWERPVRTSLNDLRQQQEGLANEIRALVEKKFENAAVFGRMLRQAADAMDLAAKRLDNRLDAAETGPFDQELEDIADSGIRGQQKLAVKRLDQLLDALKPDQQAAGARPMNGGMPPDTPPMGGAKPGEQLPPLAQLKALRALQADIAERTETFDRAHPDRTKLNDDEVAELESLEKMQLDVAELIKQLTDAPMPGM
ncbi:MAG: hypothetical protein J2P46_01240 [Zavarzinella sp.]|nr:hypothetical protein [Zavarzinella sp.]